MPAHAPIPAAARESAETQVRPDFLDHRLLQDRRSELRLAAAVRAVLQVELA
jgi:hypothetical protein